MSKVRYAIIGFGGISQTRIAPEGFALDSKRIPPLEHGVLVAATSHSPSRQKEVEAMGLKWYPSVEELLASPEIDAVFIGTNNATHYPLCMQALEAGKHIIVEKPMTVTVQEAQDIVNKAKEKNLSVGIDHMMIYNGYTIKAAKLLKEGAIGTVNDACFHMEFNLAIDPVASKQWRCSSENDSGGPVGDLASHCMYTLEFVLDSLITDVAAVYYPKITDSKVEDGIIIKVYLANGLTATCRCSFTDPRGCTEAIFNNMGYEVYGDKGILRTYTTLFQLSGHSDEPQKVRLEIDRFNSVENIEADSIQNIYRAVVERHSNSIVNKQPLDGSDALHSMKLIAACHQSAKQGGAKIHIE